MADELTIRVGKLEDNGKRLVITIFGGKRHDDRYDVDVAFMRQKWREDVIKGLRIRGPYCPDGDSNAAVHEELEEKLQAAVDSADAEPAGSLRQAAVTTMADVQSQTTEWLWEGYFPAGAISVIDGDPGLGKSQLTIDLAARVSRGDCMPPQLAPDGTFKPRSALLMNVTNTIRGVVDAIRALQKAEVEAAFASGNMTRAQIEALKASQSLASGIKMLAVVISDAVVVMVAITSVIAIVTSASMT